MTEESRFFRTESLVKIFRPNITGFKLKIQVILFSVAD